jgi:hypothetical protein
MTPTRGTVRRQVRIACPAADVWAMVGDPIRLPEWFPGITACTVDGATRVIVTGSGLPMPEEIVTIDHLLRRFQYRITAPLYGVDADPSTMALVIGGAAGNALEHLRHLMEGTS